jgi:L-ascorbate metabolism protein UlaG (beta-lactamase superfamily)
MSRPTLTFVGTATTLLHLGPFTVLTDPNFLHRGQRAYLGKGLFSKRRTEPALQPAQLPPLDGIVLSHLHGDHFDRIAKKQLDRRLPIFTTSSAADRLQSWGFSKAVGMDTWTARTLESETASLRIVSVPGVHAPAFAKPLVPPVMGSVLELNQQHELPFRLYITGDTLYRPWLREVNHRFDHLDAMLIHLGGTKILGMLVTMDHEQGACLVELLRPPLTVPIHYDDYGVFRSSLADFQRTWAQWGLCGELRTVQRGQTISLVPRHNRDDVELSEDRG